MAVRSEPEAGTERRLIALQARTSERGTQSHRHARARARGTSALSSAASSRFGELMESAPVAAWLKDSEGRYVYANPHLLATMGQHMGPAWRGKRDADMWPPAAAELMRGRDQATLEGGGPQVFSREMPFAGGLHNVLLIEFPIPIDGHAMGVGGMAIDVTEYSNQSAERDRLAAVVEQATESVMIVDLDGLIAYVNPAFERVTGYASAEVLGKNPRILSSGIQTRWFYDAMWASLVSGLPWVSDLTNRRKDGSLFTEEANISAIHDSAGAISGYVAVKRDVTADRALEERSLELARERESMGEMIRDLRAGDTPEATAQAICRRVVDLTGITAAHLHVFESNGIARTIAFAIEGQPDPTLHSIPAQWSRHLRERAAEGPWIEPWVSRAGHPYSQVLTSLRIRAIAYAPVRHDQKVIGLLCIDAEGSVEDVAEATVLPSLVEFADIAGALIGRDLAQRVDAGDGRAHSLDIIKHAAFQPVFQPIVDLASNAVVGYEALTRFTDGTNPESAFEEAASVGLGAELEIATLKAALSDAEALPASAWLNLNASPELILSGGPLRSLLQGNRRHMVVEVTEHTAIADYPAFRAAMAALGPNVELAVDDAGVGFASFRHILELHPAFVKLDRWLIKDLESDEARKAMIAGLRHFGRSTGCRLIAEGIETDREFAALRSLDIQLGQGYLLGRPMVIGDIALATPAGTRPATPATPAKAARPWQRGATKPLAPA